MNDNKKYILTVVIVSLAIWMFRWDVGVFPNEYYSYYKLDRLTGASYTCQSGICIKSEIN